MSLSTSGSIWCFTGPDPKLSFCGSELPIFHLIVLQSSFTLKPQGIFHCHFTLVPFPFLLFLPSHRALPCHVSFVPSSLSLLLGDFWKMLLNLSYRYHTLSAPQESKLLLLLFSLIFPFTQTHYLCNCDWNRLIIVTLYLLHEGESLFLLHYEVLPIKHNVRLIPLCLAYRNMPLQHDSRKNSVDSRKQGKFDPFP